MSERLPSGSLADGVRFVATGLLPSLARGLFAPRRRAMKVLTALDTDRRAIAFLDGVRRRRGGDGVRLLGGRIVVLWGPDAIKEVLDRSADDFHSGSGAKAKGMSHFQPDALTLSHGEQWRERRAVTEEVLATKDRLHPDAARFVAVVADEVARLEVTDGLTYDEWERLFDHVTLRVIFGDRARDETELTGLLAQLMSKANRIAGLSTDGDFHELYGRLERQLIDPEPGSLVARLREAPHGDTTRIVHQLPHWMFAMRDTLGANTFRALAAIVALPDVEHRVRAELGGADLADPAALDGMRYLEGCLQEAMRLWPTTPLLAREATRETTLVGVKVDEGTQVMILNAFPHRDPELPDADRLNPERWTNGSDPDYRFNHLSNGSQYCPGVPLVNLIGKAAIAHALKRWPLRLERPELDPGEPLPAMLDFFGIRFAGA